MRIYTVGRAIDYAYVFTQVGRGNLWISLYPKDVASKIENTWAFRGMDSLSKSKILKSGIE